MSTQLTARNNIVWGNTQSTGNQIFLYDGANAEITYTDIEGGYTGEGNIDLPPQFADTNFILVSTSPCIDAGNPNVQFDDPEDPENPGQALWPSQGQLRNDMGAYGGPFRNILAGLTTGINIYDQNKTKFINLNVYPNPFNNCTTISFNIPDDNSSNITIEIYNYKGQIVKQFLYIDKNTSIVWDGKDDYKNKVKPGNYYCRLTTKDRVCVKKIILINFAD